MCQQQLNETAQAISTVIKLTGGLDKSAGPSLSKLLPKKALFH